MDKVVPHTHNGVDAPQIDGSSFVGAPQTAEPLIGGTAGASYTATEQSIINSTKATVNSLIAKLQNLGLIE
jgi:hypothetical protein